MHKSTCDFFIFFMNIRGEIRYMKFNWRKILVTGTVAGMVAVTGCSGNVPENNQGNRNGQRFVDGVYARPDNYNASRTRGRRVGYTNRYPNRDGRVTRNLNRTSDGAVSGRDGAARTERDGRGGYTGMRDGVTRGGNTGTRDGGYGYLGNTRYGRTVRYLGRATRDLGQRAGRYFTGNRTNSNSSGVNNVPNRYDAAPLTTLPRGTAGHAYGYNLDNQGAGQNVVRLQNTNPAAMSAATPNRSLNNQPANCNDACGYKKNSTVQPNSSKKKEDNAAQNNSSPAPISTVRSNNVRPQAAPAPATQHKAKTEQKPATAQKPARKALRNPGAGAPISINRSARRNAAIANNPAPTARGNAIVTPYQQQKQPAAQAHRVTRARNARNIRPFTTGATGHAAAPAPKVGVNQSVTRAQQPKTTRRQRTATANQPAPTRINRSDRMFTQNQSTLPGASSLTDNTRMDVNNNRTMTNANSINTRARGDAMMYNTYNDSMFNNVNTTQYNRNDYGINDINGANLGYGMDFMPNSRNIAAQTVTVGNMDEDNIGFFRRDKTAPQTPETAPPVTNPSQTSYNYDMYDGQAVPAPASTPQPNPINPVQPSTPVRPQTRSAQAQHLMK